MTLDEYYDPPIALLFSRLKTALEASDTTSAEHLVSVISRVQRSQVLVCAAMIGEMGVAAFLCGAGVDPDQRDNHGLSPLDVACSEGHRAMVTLLLEAGASIRPGWSLAQRIAPIQHAAYQGRREVVGLLLDAGADPNDVCRHGEPSLLRIDGEILRMLRDAGGRMPTGTLRMIDRYEGLGDDRRE